MDTGPRRRLQLILAWVALVVVCAVSATLGQMEDAPNEGVAEEIGAVATLKVAVAMGNESSFASVRRQAERFPVLRLHGVVATGEFRGAAAASKELAELRTEDLGTGADAARIERTGAILRKLYDGTQDGLAARAAALPPEDRAYLHRTMYWTGRLAVAPDGADPADRASVRHAAAFALVGMGSALCVGALSLFAALGFLVGAIAGWFRTAWHFTPAQQTHPALVEAVAVAVGIVLLMGLVREQLHAFLPSYSFASAAFSVFAVGVVPLAWARLRGIPWGELRALVGLTRGRGLLREAGAGFLGFLLMLPFVFVAGLAAKLIETLTGVAARPHPEVLMAGSLDLASFLWLFVAASVVAPLVEETLFRGLVFQSLRTSTRTWGRVWSFVVSAAVQAVLFAVIHPQGIGGVPAIAAIGALLSLLREWRGSLVAPMVAHGLWNGAIFVLLACMLR